jgi:hypothetical protein
MLSMRPFRARLKSKSTWQHVTEAVFMIDSRLQPQMNGDVVLPELKAYRRVLLKKSSWPDRHPRIFRVGVKFHGGSTIFELSDETAGNSRLEGIDSE